jgi:hypothetical protein
VVDEQARGGAGAGDRDAYAEAAVGGRTAQLGANGPRVAEKVRQARQIERDLARPAPLDPRRELPRDIEQSLGRTTLRRVQRAKHD